MKIAVTRCDGDTEIISLAEPVKIHEGQFQASIHNADGTDHFFRISDGCYDGWGRGLPDPGWTLDQAKTLMDHTEQSRDFIPLTLARFVELRFRCWGRICRYYWGCLTHQSGYPKWWARGGK